MASIYSWESFIRIHGGEPGARDVFEKAMDDLLRAENPDREVHIVKASQGDGGIDVFVYQEDGIDIYQCKFFMGTLDPSRWSQIKKSFKKAMESKGVQVLRWYICMPREMQKEDIVKWDIFKEEKEKEFPDVKLRYIDGNEIISRIEECDRLNNTVLIDKYFFENRKKHFTNKQQIIPFTLSKANGAQGGTYVPRDDLLTKIEERFKIGRIIFLSGMGGCGKSELARAYGYKHRDDYEEIFWLTCDDGVVPNLIGLMEKADIKIEKSDTRDFADKVLIIVDNCNTDDPSFLGELENWTGEASILVTTRLGSMGSYESIIPVEADDPEAFAYSVFEKNYCKESRWWKAKVLQDEEEDSVREICHAVQYNTMVVSLIGIRLREYSNLSIADCAIKMKNGIGAIKGEITYAKDQKKRSEEMKGILEYLFADILNYSFSDEQKAVLTVLSLTSASWYEMDYICSLLGELSNEYAVRTLLDFGWLQGNGDRITIHPLIAEVISDHPIIIKGSAFFESLLENYLALPEKFLRKESFLINKVLKLACDEPPVIRIAVMLLINHGGYKKLFKENYPDVHVAYFLYTNYKEKRYFEYQDLRKNKTCLLVEVKCQGHETEKVVLLNTYNTGYFYKMDFNFTFHEMWIHEIPDGFCSMDSFLSECFFSEQLTIIGAGAFYKCSKLKGALKLPTNLLRICKDAFYGCSGLDGELHIPKSVTSIGDRAFYDCSGLSGELFIPEGVTSIGNHAFYNCSGLSGKLHIPESLTSIGDYAFYNCSGLSGKLHIPESLSSIGDSAFSCCHRLSGELHIPGSVTSIGSRAFYGCSGLSGELHIPESVTSIGDMAFCGCSELCGELHIPGSVTSIGLSSFCGCSGLSGELHIPDSVTSIGECAFGQCSRLNGALHIPDSVTSIGDWTFIGCSGLSGELHIPNSVTSIGESAFYGCSGLSGELHIPDSVTSIGDGAFSKCSGLNGELHIPKNVTSIGLSVFEDCSGLSGELHIPGSVTSIGASAFYGCSGLSGELHIPDSVTSIGSRAFYGCSGLSGELYIPDSVTSIGKDVFHGCSGLSGPSRPSREFHIPESVTSIGDSAFYGYSGLSGELRIPDSATSIGDWAFTDCRGLSGELHIPDSVTSIGDRAFEGCSGLSGELHIPDSVTSIGESAFYGCSGLSGELHIPDSVTSIGDGAFSECSGLNGELHIPGSVTSIGNGAFYGCSGLSGELHIPGSVTSIGSRAFYGCSGLSGELHIPGSVTSIGSRAFYGCSGLSGGLHIPESVTSIESRAFYGCSGLSGELHIPESVTSIGFNAFDSCDKIEKVFILNPNTEIEDFLTPYSDTVIVGYRHSTAETYALEHDLVFEELVAEV